MRMNYQQFRDVLNDFKLRGHDSLEEYEEALEIYYGNVKIVSNIDPKNYNTCYAWFVDYAHEQYLKIYGAKIEFK